MFLCFFKYINDIFFLLVNKNFIYFDLHTSENKALYFYFSNFRHLKTHPGALPTFELVNAWIRQ